MSKSMKANSLSTHSTSSSSPTPLPVLSPKKRSKTTDKMCPVDSRYRLVLLVAQFLLTFPRWSWSLFLFCANQSLPLPSIQQGLHQPIQNIQAVMRQESQHYEQCTKVFFSKAVHTVRNRTVQVETKRVQAIQAKNRQRLVQLENAISRCEEMVSTTRTLLRTLAHMQEEGSKLSEILPLVADPTKCTAADRRALMDWLWNASPPTQRQEILHVFESFWVHSTESLHRLGNYTLDRAAYDYDYFVGHKMNLTWFDSAFKVPILDFPEISLLDVKTMNVLDGKVLSVLHNAMVRITLLEQRLLSFLESLTSFDLRYRDLYNRLVAAAEFVRDFLPRGIPTPSYLNLAGIPVADLLLPEIFEIPHFDADLPDIVDVRIRFAKILGEYLNELRQELEERLSQAMHHAVVQLRKALEDKFTLENYNPPLLDKREDLNQCIEDELVAVQELGNKTRASLDHSLRFGVFQDNESETRRSLPNVTGTAPPDLEDKATVMHFLQPQIPHIILPRTLVAVLVLVMTHRWLIEIAIHCFRAWKLYREFARSATANPPKIVYGSRNEESPFTETLVRMQRTILEHFVAPWMAFGLVLLPIAAIGTTLWLPHAKASCVDSLEGTLLTRHIAVPILVNQVLTHGNAYYMQSQLHCHGQSERVCLESFMATDETQRNDEKAFHELLFEYKQSEDLVHLTETCIESDELDKLFHQACCMSDGAFHDCEDGARSDFCPFGNSTFASHQVYSFDQLLSSDSCPKDMTAFDLQQARFDCSALSDMCSDSPCTGIDTALLKRTIISEECRIEVYFMKCCLFVLIALYHGLMLNLCCTLIFNGIKQSWWRKTCADGIELVTRMNENGDLLRAADCVEREVRIGRAIRRFELVGKIQLNLGYGLFLVWLFSFFICGRLLSKFV